MINRLLDVQEIFAVDFIHALHQALVNLMYLHYT
jgi:hypothetical protein